MLTQISIHYILATSTTRTDYGPSLANLKAKLQLSGSSSNTTVSTAVDSYRPTSTQPYRGTPSLSPGRRANATFVFLCRNSDINGVVASIQSMEDRFNKKYHYPWVFLNDEPFTEEFKQYVVPSYPHSSH
jgi:alpha 1,2-mannosyltransferase